MARARGRLVAALCLALAARAGGGSLSTPVGAPSVGRFAFLRVNVLPMDSDRVLVDHTVLVDGERIVGIGPSRTLRVPPGYAAIDGSGRWLMPGLVDAHTHERALPEWPDDVAGNLVMSLANGITGILNMGDFTGDMIRVRDEVRAGRTPGPTVLVGHFVRGRGDGGTPDTIVDTEADARSLARRARAQGYDFLKVYDGVPAAAFDALVAEGAAVGLPVTGHAVRQVGLSQGLARGQVMVAHASPFLALLPAASPAAATDLGRRVAASGASVTATLFVFELIAAFGLDGLEGRDAWARVITQEGVEFMDDRALEAWAGMYRFRSDLRAPRDTRSQVGAMRQFVRGLSDAGGSVLLGTDTIGVPGVVPGFSIHHELRALEAAGLSRWQVLATGTHNAGAFGSRHLGGPRFGRVEEGARADLLLLEGDPLEDPEVLRRPSVMAAGRWYPREALVSMLDALRAR